MIEQLTLDIDSETINKVRRMAKLRKTTINAFLTDIIASLDEANMEQTQDWPPLTKRVLEMSAKLPKIPNNWDYHDILSDNLAEKHGLK